MTEVKTEFATMEEHSNAVRKAIEREAYALYERDGFKDENDQEYWFYAERELTICDIPCSIENDAVLVRLPMEKYAPSTLGLSISPRSLLIFSLRDDASNDCGDNRDLLREIPFPMEVDSAKIACELNDRDLALRLPLVVGAPTVSTFRRHLAIRRLALLTFSNGLKYRDYLKIRPGGLYGSTGSNPLCATAR